MFRRPASGSEKRLLLDFARCATGHAPFIPATTRKRSPTFPPGDVCVDGDMRIRAINSANRERDDDVHALVIDGSSVRRD